MLDRLENSYNHENLRDNEAFDILRIKDQKYDSIPETINKHAVCTDDVDDRHQIDSFINLSFEEELPIRKEDMMKEVLIKETVKEDLIVPNTLSYTLCNSKFENYEQFVKHKEK